MLMHITEVQVKKHLTAEEHAMRRAEMARRRKNLSEKRNEEEKAWLHFIC
jgi:Ino eighty subunit 2